MPASLRAGFASAGSVIAMAICTWIIFISLLRGFRSTIASSSTTGSAISITPTISPSLRWTFDYRGRRDLSRYLTQRMADALRDQGILELMDFYKCYRAFVRGKVDSLQGAGARLREGSDQQSRPCPTVFPARLAICGLWIGTDGCHRHGTYRFRQEHPGSFVGTRTRLGGRLLGSHTESNLPALRFINAAEQSRVDDFTPRRWQTKPMRR